jgi:hypothetical protein
LNAKYDALHITARNCPRTVIVPFQKNKRAQANAAPYFS